MRRLCGGSARAAGEGGAGEEGKPDRETDQGDERGGDEEPLDRVGAVLAGLERGVAHAPVPARAPWLALLPHAPAEQTAADPGGDQQDSPVAHQDPSADEGGPRAVDGSRLAVELGRDPD